MLLRFLKGEIKSKYSIILIATFVVSSIYILSFPYPLGEGAQNPNAPHQPNRNAPWQRSMWGGGTIPDENAYFQWAWVYYTTGKNYIPLEDIGPDKIQHFSFIIGNTHRESYFIRVYISQIGERWETRFRNVTVYVYDGLNEGMHDIPVDIVNKKTGDIMQGITNKTGKVKFGISPGHYRAVAHVGDYTLNLDFSTDFPNLDYPIITYATLEKFSHGNATVRIHVDHYINGNLSGVEVHLYKNSEPSGYTDKNGDFYLHAGVGIYGITTIKRTYHIAPPVGSVVVYVNGKYALANRWAPGYSYMIIPFYLLGLINFIFLITFFIGGASTYILARRLYNKTVAFYATFLFMVSALSLMMLFSRGMADYATMAFSTAGIMLLVESIQKREYERLINPILAFSSGLSLGFAVLIRYSTVTVVLAPLIYITVIAVKNRKSEIFKKNILSLSTFLIALLIMAVILISYNTTLFGGPLNSGYQMSHRVEFSNGNATVETPSTNMFEKYFHPSLESLQNIFGRILPQLFILLPTLFISPIGFLLDYRKIRSWLLLLWGIPTIIIYMQLQWVGHVPYEDMRYFLPILPPTSILSGLAMNYLKRGERNASFLLLIVTGFVSSFFAINWQLHRREFGGEMWREPPIYLFIIVLTAYIIVYYRHLMIWIKKHTKISL